MPNEFESLELLKNMILSLYDHELITFEEYQLALSNLQNIKVKHSSS